MFKLGPLQEKWLAALESEEYPQGTKYLCQKGAEGGYKYCCLGVGGLIVGLTIEYLEGKRNLRDVVDVVDDESSPWKLLGLNHERGWISHTKQSRKALNRDDLGCLDSLNDTGMSFKLIAAFIRKFPQTVFRESR